MMGDNMIGRTIVGGVSGGVGSAAAGGDFGQGFQAGAYNAMFNCGFHEGVGKMKEFARVLWKNKPNQVTMLNFTFTHTKPGEIRVDLNALPDIGIGRSYTVYGEDGNISIGMGKWGGQVGVDFLDNHFKGMSVGYSRSLLPVNITLIKGKNYIRY